MKIYKYWTKQKQNITVDGQQQEIVSYGGSNLSVEDAARNALEKLSRLQRKINRDRSAFEDYEVEIREEILQTIYDDAVITRNRYGARVLNVEKLLILDIDQPKSSLGDMFKKKDAQQDKAKILDMVRKLAESTKYKDLAFRLYETAQGARVIVTGRSFDPRDEETIRLMQEFNCDRLYVTLCQKQNCYRARLTPKPSRMHMKLRKVYFPREANPALDQWLADYEAKSESYGTCKFIQQIGAPLPTSDVIQMHDELSKAYMNLPLA